MITPLPADEPLALGFSPRRLLRIADALNREVDAGALPGAVLALYLLFAVVNTHPSREPSVPLTLARGGLVVGARDAARYDSLVGLLQAHASGGYVYAAPDCPEVAFLAGLKNPTRTIWEFLSDTIGRTERVLEALDEHAVTTVAIK